MAKKKTIELSDQLLLEVGGKPRTIKMTFGLLNRTCQLVGDAEGAVQLLLDPNLQQAVILEILSERNDDGQIVRKHDVEDYDFSKEEVLILLTWVSDHLLDFFLKSLKIAKDLQGRNLEMIESLKFSSDGSPS